MIKEYIGLLILILLAYAISIAIPRKIIRNPVRLEKFEKIKGKLFVIALVLVFACVIYVYNHTHDKQFGIIDILGLLALAVSFWLIYCVVYSLVGEIYKGNPKREQHLMVVPFIVILFFLLAMLFSGLLVFK